MKKFINDNEVYSIENDDGKEFNLLQKYCNDSNINYIKINKVYSKNSMTVVERFNKTTRNKITNYQIAYNP